MVTAGQWRQTDDARGFCVVLNETASGAWVQHYAAFATAVGTGGKWYPRAEIEALWPTETTLEDIIAARVVADRVRWSAHVMGMSVEEFRDAMNAGRVVDHG